MYSSLDRIDMIAKSPDGERVMIQTDHRSPEEIDAEPELSIVFALARTLGPLRSSEAAGATVRYVALGGVHPGIARVVASTGAALEVAGQPVELGGVERSAPEDLADAAFAGLARRVLAREGLAADEAGLAAFERSCAGVPTRQDDEIAYWTTVVELSAVAGEVMRARFGGRWVADPQHYCDLPFMFRSASGEMLSNVIDKVQRFLAHGELQSPRHLLRALEDTGTDGPILFTLKPAAWAADNDMVSEPLAELGSAGADVPFLVYGRDHPNTFAMFKRGETPRDLAELRREALANLADIEVEVEKVELERLTFWVVHGNYFAGEKLLDAAFMARLHAEIGELLAVTLPEKGRLFVTNAVADPEAIGGFVSLARGVYERNEGGRALAPTVFLVSDAKIVGVARADEAAAQPGERGKLKKKSRDELN